MESTTISPKQALRNLYVSQKGTDFTIRCQDKEFQVHSFFLAQFGGYFGGLFNGDRFSESNEKCIDLSDTEFEPVIIKTMIEYMYCIEDQPESFPVEGSPSIQDPAMYHAYCFAAGEFFQLDAFKRLATQRLREFASLDGHLDFLWEIAGSSIMPFTTSRPMNLYKERSWYDVHLHELTRRAQVYNATTVLNAAEVVFTTTPDSVRDLRRIVVRMLHLLPQLGVQYWNATDQLLRDVPGLGTEFARYMVKKQGWNRRPVYYKNGTSEALQPGEVGRADTLRLDLYDSDITHPIYDSQLGLFDPRKIGSPFGRSDTTRTRYH